MKSIAFELEAPVEAGAAEQLQYYFEVYCRLDKALGTVTGDSDEEAADSLLHAQSVVLAAAANLPSTDFAGVLYKLALWRWENPDLDPDLTTMSRSEAIAYSAFRDLAVLMDRNDVLKDIDRL
jgi:hypothetical protein